MPTIIRLEDDEVDALYAWIENQIQTTEFTATNVNHGFISPMDSWSPPIGADAEEHHQHLHRPTAVLTECREQRKLLMDLRPHLHANTPAGKLARLVLQRLGAGLSTRAGYRQEWRP